MSCAAEIKSGGEVLGKKNQNIQQQINNEYDQLVQQMKPKPPYLRNILAAFIVGGIICVIGQFVQNFYTGYIKLSVKEAAGPTSATMIFIGALLTGLGIYDEIGKFAGAGSVVPITGFANSMVAPALEFKREGYIFGVGAKMFTIAGPVIVYGVITSIVFGLITWLLKG